MAMFNFSMVVNAQAVQVQSTRIDHYLQTAIHGNAPSDVLDVVLGPEVSAPCPSGADLLWVAYYQAQPNNPGLFSLMTYPWLTCFQVKANGYTGIFNTNPSVALEIGSSSSAHLVKVNGGIAWGSDARMKENIRDISNSFDKLKQLRSVSYNFKEDEKEQPIPEKLLEEGISIEKIRADRKNAPKANAYLLDRTFYGFLAQDVEKLFPDLVYKDSAGMLSVDYIGIIPLLLDGLKDQQTQIEEQQTQIGKQQSQIDEQREQIKQLVKLMDIKQINEKVFEENGIQSIPLLLQNTPNPFNQATEIGYYIPETVNSANIYIYDINGFQQKNIAITERGSGTTTLQASALQAGIYFYTLICDGKPVDTKQMILTR